MSLLPPLRLTGAEILLEGAMQDAALGLACGRITAARLPEVDFPAPDRPMMPMNPALSSVKLARSTAVLGPKRRVTSFSCSTPRLRPQVTIGVDGFSEGGMSVG